MFNISCHRIPLVNFDPSHTKAHSLLEACFFDPLIKKEPYVGRIVCIVLVFVLKHLQISLLFTKKPG